MGRPPVHGKSRAPVYAVWRSMMGRCLRPTHPAFADYGGRGITVSEEWQTFEGFYRDMGDQPPGLTLERNDNDGPYLLANCRWATRHEQGRNKRNNHLITANGLTLTMAEWAQRLGVSIQVIAWREAAGWSPERTVSEPARTQQSDMRAMGKVG